MKTNDLKKPLYSAYILDQESKAKLLEIFPPKYTRTVAHHATVKFGNVGASDVPSDAVIKVIGYVDTADGLEALVVSVDGREKRSDGSINHITWSLNPSEYKPVDSNKVIAKYGYETVTPIEIKTTPKVVFV